jgi:outer membrane assembly lipoprotein YfiO
MLGRIPMLVLVGVLAVTTACSNKKVSNPLANVDSKQPDKVLFDRAMDALKHNRFDVARITLQTLINTYPDSEYIARAKLAVADSWYAEGGSTNLTQAEVEYKDFITFFPNMPEAAEAQLKIAITPTPCGPRKNTASSSCSGPIASWFPKLKSICWKCRR